MKEKGYFEYMFTKGKDNYKLVFFDIQVLERYFEDPKYIVFFHDYRGSIIIDDQYANPDFEDLEYLQDFGLAYKKDDRYDRAIVVFAGDLIELPCKMQSHFHSYYLENQDEYYPSGEFVKNLIYGEWIDTISIYQALTMEIHYINEMCTAIGIPKIFLKEYPMDARLQNERPNNFHTILVPTQKRYYDFIITLEKMITGNINIKAFLATVPEITKVERKNEQGLNKGSVALLSEWFKVNVRFADISNDIEKPLKELVKLRQTPAHEIFENKFDKTIWKQQNDFMIKIYTAVRNIRLLLANHPKTKSVEIPDYLYDGEHICVY